MGKKPTNQNIGLPGILLKRQRAINVILMAMLFAGFMISCEKLDEPSEQTVLSGENVFRYDVTNSFTSLKPAEMMASGSAYIFPLLYSYLFVPDSSGELRPDLATQWVFNPEKLQWIIHLRNDAVFHNNKAVTSRDVMYSYKTMIKALRPELNSVIKRISLLSDTVLCIILKKEDPLLLQKIWDFEIFPHPDAGEIDYYNHPIGSGPFKFKKRDANQEIHLEANANYYCGRPSLDKIIFYYQPDKEKSWIRLLSGDTDVAQEISPKNYEMIRQYKDRFYFNHYTLHYYTILLYNTYDPLFSDPKVRMALTYAIDREYIVNDILNSYGKVANGPMGVDSPYYNPEVKPLPFAPQEALLLLKEAGWSHDKKVAQYIQLCLNDLGIRARIEALPFEGLHRRYYRNTEFQAVLTEFGASYRNPEDVSDFWSTLFRAKSIAGCFEHPEVNRLIKKGLYEKDPKKQKKLFQKIDELITSLQPGTFLYQKTAIDVMSKRFSLPPPFSLTYEGIHRLRHAALMHQ